MPTFQHFLRALSLAALAYFSALCAAQAADKPRVMARRA